jgi:hypothetical protein
MTSTRFQMGGTGVAPVKSGVPPDFVGGRPLLFARGIQGRPVVPNSFGRDTRNNRPEARATHQILKIHREISPAEVLL